MCQRSGCRLQRTSTLFSTARAEGFARGPWQCDKDHLYTQCACHATKGRLGISGSFLGSWFPPSLFPTSDSFTTGRPWEKSLRRRNSSQFGQCKALKASSIVFSNAALTAVVIILHSQNHQKSRFPQPLVGISQKEKLHFNEV